MLTVASMPTTPRLKKVRDIDRDDEQVERAREMGRRIILARDAVKITQQQLQARLEVDSRTMRKWEAGAGRRKKITQTTITEAERAEGGAVTQGQGPNTLYVGHSYELIYQIERECDVDPGSLSLGIYRPADQTESLESHIDREPGLTPAARAALKEMVRIAKRGG